MVSEWEAALGQGYLGKGWSVLKLLEPCVPGGFVGVVVGRGGRGGGGVYCWSGQDCLE